MYGHALKILFFAVFLIFEIVVLPSVPFFRYGNFLAMLFVFLYIYEATLSTFFLTLIGGALLETISSLPLGTIILSIFLTQWIAQIIFNKFLSNRSAPSILIFSFLVGFLYKSIVFVLGNLLVRTNPAAWQHISFSLYMADIIEGTILNGSFLLILFYIQSRFFSKSYQFV